MPQPPASHPPLTAHYALDGQRWRRPVSARTWSATLTLPPCPVAVLAEWTRCVQHELALAPGDVEVLPWGQTRRRWPAYRGCADAAAQALAGQGLDGLLADSPPTLMVCLGARYHHDAEQYGEAVFCNLFLCDEAGLDLHFPLSGQRLPLQRGTLVLFDPSQPHGVVARHSLGFEAPALSPAALAGQVFLSWELSLDHAALRDFMGTAIARDDPPDGLPADPPDDPPGPLCTAPTGPALGPGTALRWAGVPGGVCPDTGDWQGPALA